MLDIFQCKHPVSEVFSCSEYHKCLALQSGPYQLFAVFIPAVPNHSMRANMIREWCANSQGDLAYL